MIIAGAGGHAKEIFMLMTQEERAGVSFFDDTNGKTAEWCYPACLLTSEEETKAQFEKDPKFIIATGNPFTRERLFTLLKEWGGQPATFSASTAFISDVETVVGEGANIMHEVFISSSVKMGVGCLVNTRAHLHHDVTLGDFCEIGPAAILLGHVKIGKKVLIGAGAVLLPGINVDAGAKIGAGSVVIKDVHAGMTVKGNPAR